jgi:hypothetical protein
LYGLPVCGINGRVWIVNPDAKAIVDELMQYEEVRANQGYDLFGFVDGNEEIWDGGCW